MADVRELEQDNVVNVTPMLGRHLSPADQQLFARYHTAFQLAIHWPDVENFRACVAAYDEMVAPKTPEAR